MLSHQSRQHLPLPTSYLINRGHSDKYRGIHLLHSSYNQTDRSCSLCWMDQCNPHMYDHTLTITEQQHRRYKKPLIRKTKFYEESHQSNQNNYLSEILNQLNSQSKHQKHLKYPATESTSNCVHEPPRASIASCGHNI